MSYESRRKKRAYKRAAVKSRRSEKTAARWFLTIAKRPGKCACCGHEFRRGAEIVFRFEPRDLRCLRCADRDPEIRYRASLRWEKAKGLPKAA
jgi:hypothetical protein